MKSKKRVGVETLRKYYENIHEIFLNAK